MKKIIVLFCLYYCIAEVSAQSDSLKLLMGISPFYTTNYHEGALKYPVRVQNNIANGSNFRYETPLTVGTYWSAELPIHVFKPLNPKFFWSYGVNLKLQHYESVLNYYQYTREGYDSETIHATTFEVNFGFAKLFYLDDKQRFLLMTETSTYMSTYSFTSEEGSDPDINDNLYPTQTSKYSRDDINLGMYMNVWLTYRIARKWGIGFQLPRVVGIYGYANSVPNTPDEWDEGIKFNISPTPLPRIYVCGYF
jgi:hypothetical protein